MYGLENISANNGWAISILGISIVFTGLTLLSLTIAQLHKVLDLWENRKERSKKVPEKTAATAPKDVKAKGEEEEEEEEKLDLNRLPYDIREKARQFKLLAERLEKPLSLPELLYLAQKVGLESPHSNLNELLKKKAIVPDGKGFYHWNF